MTGILARSNDAKFLQIGCDEENKLIYILDGLRVSHFQHFDQVAIRTTNHAMLLRLKPLSYPFYIRNFFLIETGFQTWFYPAGIDQKVKTEYLMKHTN